MSSHAVTRNGRFAAVRALIFDLDGTLIDTAPELASAVNAALAERALTAVEEAQVRCWIGNGTRQLMLNAYRHATGADAAEAGRSPLFASLLHAFDWHYAAMSGRGSTLYPEVAAGLQALRRLGVATALVTNKETRFTAPLLHAHDLWDDFDAIVCGDMLAQKKPHPLPVEHCITRLGTTPARTLLVGDSEVDVATARNAGVPVWAVSYGYGCGRLHGERRPDRLVSSIAAVAQAIAQEIPAREKGTSGAHLAASAPR